jgi:hypothetical protein
VITRKGGTVKTLTVAAMALLTVGCSSLQVSQKTIGKGYQVMRVSGNLYGPGQSCLLLIRGTEVAQLGCVGGPDAGVALGTAGLQGAAIAGGAAVLGTSFPANKGTNVSATGGAGGVADSNSASGSVSTSTGGTVTGATATASPIAANDQFTVIDTRSYGPGYNEVR